ncbi:hypothetical protein BC829DRAFT_446006 [Chytridium lagenaria]|nr:hypothetical protein BC829DRAFT_446006 [Chytridium lagenaria]
MDLGANSSYESSFMVENMKGNTLPQEIEEGNVEYKLKLVNLPPERVEHLITQLKWRLAEGGGEAMYEIGVADNGELIGLNPRDLEASLSTLRLMGSKLGADVSLIRKSEVSTCLFLEVRVAILGGADAGKSTLVGVLSHSEFDNGRGKSRLNLLRHRHEIETGRTSSIAHQIIGFNPVGDLINYGSTPSKTWEQVCETASKVVTFLDTCGHPKYQRTTISGCGGVSEVPREHLGIAVGLTVPVFVVITKIDVATQEQLTRTVSSLLGLLKSPGVKRVPMVIQNENDCVVAVSSLVSSRVVPIFLTSSVTGENMELLIKFLNLLPKPTQNDDVDTTDTTEVEFAIEEVYSVPSVGTVLGGILQTGQISLHSRSLLQPTSNSNLYYSDQTVAVSSPSASTLSTVNDAPSTASSQVKPPPAPSPSSPPNSQPTVKKSNSPNPSTHPLVQGAKGAGDSIVIPIHGRLKKLGDGFGEPEDGLGRKEWLIVELWDRVVELLGLMFKDVGQCWLNLLYHPWIAHDVFKTTFIPIKTFLPNPGTSQTYTNDGDVFPQDDDDTSTRRVNRVSSPPHHVPTRVWEEDESSWGIKRKGRTDPPKPIDTDHDDRKGKSKSLEDEEGDGLKKSKAGNRGVKDLKSSAIQKERKERLKQPVGEDESGVWGMSEAEEREIALAKAKAMERQKAKSKPVLSDDEEGLWGMSESETRGLTATKARAAEKQRKGKMKKEDDAGFPGLSESENGGVNSAEVRKKGKGPIAKSLKNDAGLWGLSDVELKGGQNQKKKGADVTVLVKSDDDDDDVGLWGLSEAEERGLSISKNRATTKQQDKSLTPIKAPTSPLRSPTSWSSPSSSLLLPSSMSPASTQSPGASPTRRRSRTPSVLYGSTEGDDKTPVTVETGGRAKVRLRFEYEPEWMRVGAPVLFRGAKMKCVGRVSGVVEGGEGDFGGGGR